MSGELKPKVAEILACPACGGELGRGGKGWACNGCGAEFQEANNTPILIPDASPVMNWYKVTDNFDLRDKKSAGGFAKTIFQLLRRPERIWTRRSRNLLEKILAEKSPNDPGRVVVLIGAGYEKVYRQVLSPYDQIVRIGLAHHGETDLCCDSCHMPIKSGSVDMILSSSVLEHVYDPEKAIAEMERVLKPDGYVYAEVPFMRAYHMAPNDFQRYTIAGIRQVFERGRFETVDNGICSGPFNALAVFLKDFLMSLFAFNRVLMKGVGLVVGLVLHPLKFLDRLFENADWAKVPACNFYYLGRKHAPAAGDD